MRLIFADQGWEDFCYWIEHDPRIAKRIAQLIKEIERQPFAGRGKPKPLKHDLTGFWSRRTTEEHRLVCAVEGDQILIAQARYDY